MEKIALTCSALLICISMKPVTAQDDVPADRNMQPHQNLKDAASTNLPLRLALDLTDGSRVIGTPSVEAIPVKTPYAEMKIPVDRVKSVTFRKHEEPAALELRNGDKLQGEVTLKDIEIDALFGRTTIRLEHLTCINVLAAGDSGVSVTFTPGTQKDMQARLQKIIIPELDFRGANIHDVAAFFQDVSRDREPVAAGAPPRSRGVNVIVDLRGHNVPVITFSARKISLAEALKIVCEVGGLTQTVMGNTVMLKPKAER